MIGSGMGIASLAGRKLHPQLGKVLMSPSTMLKTIVHGLYKAAFPGIFCGISVIGIGCGLSNEGLSNEADRAAQGSFEDSLQCRQVMHDSSHPLQKIVLEEVNSWISVCDERPECCSVDLGVRVFSPEDPEYACYSIIDQFYTYVSGTKMEGLKQNIYSTYPDVSFSVSLAAGFLFQESTELFLRFDNETHHIFELSRELPVGRFAITRHLEFLTGYDYRIFENSILTLRESNCLPITVPDERPRFSEGKCLEGQTDYCEREHPACDEESDQCNEPGGVLPSCGALGRELGYEIPACVYGDGVADYIASPDWARIDHLNLRTWDCHACFGYLPSRRTRL